jgi:uncharacterized protein YjdB
VCTDSSHCRRSRPFASSRSRASRARHGGNPFAVTLFDANNGEISDGRTITYTSSMPDIFSVDPRTGAVTGKTTGAGLYRATVSGRFIEASVKIISPVDRVQLNTGDFVLTVGNTRQLVPTLTSPNGSAISGRAINFASSNPAVASVGTGGLVTAVTEGTTTITATSEGGTVVVTVQREMVASIRLAAGRTLLRSVASCRSAHR